MKTSLSSLIKKEEYYRFDIESFEEEDLGGNQDMLLEAVPGKRVVLPLGQVSGGMPAILPVGNGRDKIAALEREAYEKGFAQGQKDGLDLGERKALETWKQMSALFKELESLKGRAFSESEEEIVQLSLAIARKIVKREVSLDTDMVRRSVRSASEFLNDKSFMRVLIHPNDMKNLEQYLPELAEDKKIQRFELAEDNCVGPGGCILESGFGRINATIEGQLDELEMEIEDLFQSQGVDEK
ncbi:MAG: FliH/SctL family protein [Desulfatiglandaceae bacterium]